MDIQSTAMLAAFSMVAWKQPTFHSLLELVVANDRACEAGTILSEREVSEWTGMSRSSVFAGFAKLVEHRVLLRVDGGGPRGHALRVNPDLREWDVKWRPPREVALFRIRQLLHPDEVHKNRSAARPVSALTSTAARPVAVLSEPSRATGRATNDPLPARTVARVENPADGDTQLPVIEEPHSLTHEGGREVIAAIYQTSGRPVLGRLEARVHELVNGHDTTELIAKIRATPGLKIVGYVAMVEQHLAAAALPSQSAAPSPMWEPPDTSDSSPPPWRKSKVDPREWAMGVAPSCENGDGGAP